MKASLRLIQLIIIIFIWIFIYIFIYQQLSLRLTKERSLKPATNARSSSATFLSPGNDMASMANALHTLYQPLSNGDFQVLVSLDYVVVRSLAPRDAESLLRSYRWIYEHAYEIYSQLHVNQTLVVIIDDLHQLSSSIKLSSSLVEDMLRLWQHLQLQSGYHRGEVVCILLSTCMSKYQGLRYSRGKSRLCPLYHLKMLSNASLRPSQLPVSNTSTCLTTLDTRKYEDCMPPPERIAPILITGLGGSGTHYVSNLLRWMNIDVRHEGLGIDGSVSWMYTVNDIMGGQSYPHHAQLSDSSLWSPRFRHVLHLTRCPLMQIASLTSHLDASYAFIFRFVHLWAQYNDSIKDLISRYPTISSPTTICNRQPGCNLHRAMLAWTSWTYILQSYADSRIAVESPEKLLSHVCKLLINGDRSNSSRYHRCRRFLTMSTIESQDMILQANSSISAVLACVTSMKSTTFDIWSTLLLFRRSNIRRLPSDCANDIWSQGYRYSSPAHHLHPSLTVDLLNEKDPYLSNLIIDLANSQGYNQLC